MSTIPKPSVEAKPEFDPIMLGSLNRPIIPLRPKDKTPISRGYPDFPPSSVDDINNTINNRYGWNLGIVCGGGLYVMDFDVPEDYESFKARFPLKTMVVSTGRGYHVYLRSDEGAVGCNDFYLPMNTVKSGEFRAQGGYVTAYGSLHKSGALYTIIEGSPEEIQTVAPEFLQQFLKDNAVPRVISKRESGPNVSHTSGYSTSWSEAELCHANMKLTNKGLDLEQKWRLVKQYRREGIFVNDRSEDDDRSALDMSCAHMAVSFGITESEFIELAEQYPNGLGAKYQEEGEGYLIHTYQKALMTHTFKPDSFTSANTLNNKYGSGQWSRELNEKMNNEDRIMNLFHRRGSRVSVREITNSKCIRDGDLAVRSVKEVKSVVDQLVTKGLVYWDGRDKPAKDALVVLV